MSAANANPFAYLVLLLWFPFALMLFSTLRPQLATMITIIGGTLFLPERLNFDLPLVPPLGKTELSSLAALVGCLTKMRRQLIRTRPLTGIGLFVPVLLLGAVGTVLTNRDPLKFGETVIPGMEVYDTLAMPVRISLEIGVPFLLGRAVLRDRRDLQQLYRVVGGFGLVYGLLALVEIRLSPQLHNWIYGYHQHSFAQTMRWGGYRPTIFLAHGLAVGMWLLAATMDIVLLSRVKSQLAGIPTRILALCMTVVFVLAKSTGAIAYAVITLPACLIGSPKLMLRLSLVFAVLMAIYPVSKMAGFFPEDALVNAALEVSAERADSLQDRFDNDHMLQDRARERLLFGWGMFGRSRVYDENGTDISVTDGYWIIQLGSQGTLGILAIFGLLLLPISRAHKALPKILEKRDRVLLSGLALMSVFYAVDLLPNGLYNALPVFFSGALLGLAEGLTSPEALAAAAQDV